MISKVVQCSKCGNFQGTKAIYKFTCKVCGKSNVMKKLKVYFVSNDFEDVDYVIKIFNKWRLV